jgi:hypothetical protein
MAAEEDIRHFAQELYGKFIAFLCLHKMMQPFQSFLELPLQTYAMY